jgi:hypothetical protein
MPLLEKRSAANRHKPQQKMANSISRYLPFFWVNVKSRLLNSILPPIDKCDKHNKGCRMSLEVPSVGRAGRTRLL